MLKINNLHATALPRHCERSGPQATEGQPIQSRAAQPWIAASPSAPRNDELKECHVKNK
jgi:hypothetical protein